MNTTEKKIFQSFFNSTPLTIKGTNYYNRYQTVERDKVMVKGKEVIYLLHNSEIVKKVDGKIIPNLQTLKNYPTRTTISRFRIFGFDVYQKNKKIYFNGKIVAEV